MLQKTTFHYRKYWSILIFGFQNQKCNSVINGTLCGTVMGSITDCHRRALSTLTKVASILWEVLLPQCGGHNRCRNSRQRWDTGNNIVLVAQHLHWFLIESKHVSKGLLWPRSLKCHVLQSTGTTPFLKPSHDTYHQLGILLMAFYWWTIMDYKAAWSLLGPELRDFPFSDKH